MARHVVAGRFDLPSVGLAGESDAGPEHEDRDVVALTTAPNFGKTIGVDRRTLVRAVAAELITAS